MLVGLCRLFRLRELFSLRLRLVSIVEDHFCFVTMTSSKTSGPVAISIRDATLIFVLWGRVRLGHPDDLLYSGPTGQLASSL